MTMWELFSGSCLYHLSTVYTRCLLYRSSRKVSKHVRSGRLFEVAMLRKCTLLWREAHFEVKSGKTPGVRTTFGRWDVEKVHAVVAWSTFSVNMFKLPHVRATFGRVDCHSMSKKCAPLWQEAHLEVESVKKQEGLSHFWCVRCRFVKLVS